MMCATVNPIHDNMSDESVPVKQCRLSQVELSHPIFTFDISHRPSFTCTFHNFLAVCLFAAASAGTPPAGKQHRAAGRASSVWLVISGLAGP